MFYDLSKLTREHINRMNTRIKEIEKLYDVSEAEMILVQQLAMLVSTLELSPELSNKCLKCLTAINEMLHEELPKEMK